MTNHESSTDSDDGASRSDRFRGDVATLDVPTPSTSSETRWLYGGVGLALVGVVFIAVGYWGASGTADPAQQLPYMLSGGAMGLALVVMGAFLVGRYSMARLMRFWLALLVAEHRAQTDRLVEALEARDKRGA